MKTGTFVAMVFLIAVAVAHILRILFHVEATVNGHNIPLWLSYAAVILTLVLAAAIWNEHRRNNQR
jgi:phosphate starvation-inducible membrane PsiE